MVASDLHRACARNLALEAQANEHGHKLQDAAERELLRINSELRSIKPGDTLVDSSVAARYSQLVKDRAKIVGSISG